jgi:hypothetical protein
MPRSCRWYDVKEASMSYPPGGSERRAGITSHDSMLTMQQQQQLGLEAGGRYRPQD